MATKSKPARFTINRRGRTVSIYLDARKKIGHVTFHELARRSPTRISQSLSYTDGWAARHSDVVEALCVARDLLLDSGVIRDLAR